MENAQNGSGAVPANRWVCQLASFLGKGEKVQAVAWQDGEEEVEVATLGNVGEEQLRQLMREVLAGGSTSALQADIRYTQQGERHRLEKWHGCEEITRLWQWRKIPWPDAGTMVGLEEEDRDGHEHEDEDWRELAALAGVCGVLGLIAFVLEKTGWVAHGWIVGIYIAAMIAGGWDAAKDAFPNIVRGRLDIHFLMLAVAIGASLIGAYGEGALLLFLFSFAGALEHFALHRTRHAIDSLFHLAPKTTTVIDSVSGAESEFPVDKVISGMKLRVRPGDTFAVDGEVIDGESAADESSLTGEAHPVDKVAGSKVYSGTLNLWGSLDLVCLRPASQSSLQKIIHLIRSARKSRAPSQRLTDRFGPSYTWGVLGVTAAMFVLWWQVLGLTAPDAFYRAMTLLVVASPCALVLSIPSAILAAIASGARHGILFRGGAAIEQLAGVEAVAFDKTGTLTTGSLQVVQVESFPQGREDLIARLAFSMEQKANHPIANAIIAHGEANGFVVEPLQDFRSLTGQGIQAKWKGQPVLLGRRELMMHGPLTDWAADLPEPEDGLTEVWLLMENTLGRILLADTVRDASKGVIHALKEQNILTVMLTGDRPSAGNKVGLAIGIDEIHAGLSPEAKVDAIRDLRNPGRFVAMVGDGINDAPCLAAADIGVAMGARGSDAALEQSDVVLMNDRLERFLDALMLSKRAKRIIRQNIVISLGTIIVMVGAAVAGVIPIAVGVLAHEGSTVLVCLNSMRLLRIGAVGSVRGFWIK